MRVAALLVVLVVLVSGCVSTKAPADVVISDELYYIGLMDDYTMLLTYQFTARNSGGSDALLEFSINPGFQHPTCLEILNGKMEEVVCSTEVIEERFLQRNLKIDRPLKQGDRASFSLNLYGCPITLSYEPFLKEEVSEISSYWLVNHRYRGEGNKKISLTVQDPEYPVVVGEGVKLVEKSQSPVREQSTNSKAIAPKNHTTYNYTAEGSFRACVSDFANLKEERDGIIYKVYLAPSDRDLLPWVLDTASGAVGRYSDVFYPYPFKEYTVLANDKNRASGGGNGGANYTIYNTISDYYLLVHEIGHAWFGSMVGPAEGRDGWLGEGGASYCELVMGERRDDFREHLKEMHRGALTDDEPVVREDPSMWVMYDKGAVVFRMLQYVMGDAFYDLMHELFQRYNGEGITTEDFIALANEYGDYQWFFDQWLYRGGAPDYSIRDMMYENGTLTFRVVQEGEIYRMPLDVAFIMDDGKEARERVLVYEKEELLSFVIERPAEIVLDPDMWVLKRFDLSEDPDAKWTYVLS